MKNEGAAAEVVEALILDGADEDTIEAALTASDPGTDNLNTSADEAVVERKS